MLRIAFFGSSQFSIPIYKALCDMPISLVLVVTKFPDKKGEKTPGYLIAQLAKNKNITTCKPQRLHEEVKKQLTSQQVDLAVLASYGNIIPEELLTWPTHGWLNVHPSLLPAYRGATPIQSAIYHGETTTGVTLMKMDAGIDSGPIISQEQIVIPENCTGGQLTDLLAVLSAKMITRDLLPYVDGKIQEKVQQQGSNTYTKKISKEISKINWNLPAKTVWDHIRAYTPDPGAWTILGPNRIEIISGSPLDNYQSTRTGAVVDMDKKLLITCAHNSALEILQLKVSGKKACDARAFLNGYRQLLGLTCS